MGLWPTQGDEKRLGPATTLYEPSPSPCHPDPDFLPRFPDMSGKPYLSG
jgi:hypothetical protein